MNPSPATDSTLVQRAWQVAIRRREVKVCLWLGALAAAVALLTTGCEHSSDTRRVVLYVSADDHLVREVIAEFEQQTGIRVDFVGRDIENDAPGIRRVLAARTCR